MVSPNSAAAAATYVHVQNAAYLALCLFPPNRKHDFLHSWRARLLFGTQTCRTFMDLVLPVLHPSLTETKYTRREPLWPSVMSLRRNSLIYDSSKSEITAVVFLKWKGLTSCLNRLQRLRPCLFCSDSKYPNNPATALHTQTTGGRYCAV